MSIRKVVLVDLDVHLVVDERADVHLGERRVAPRLRVERRDPHQPVDAALGGEQAVGVLAVDDEGRRLEPRLLALGRLGHLDPEAAPLGPAQVHPQQHLGPVLRVGAAGARAHRDDGVAGVVLAVEEARLLELGQPALDRGELLVELGGDLGILGRHLDEVAEVGDVGARATGRSRASAARAACRAEVFAAGSWSSQKPGRLHRCLERGYLGFERGGVKGSPRAGSAPRVPP